MISKTFANLSEEDRKELNRIKTEFIFEVLDLLEKHGGKPWIDCGTLLGAVRDKSFIPWDNDTDISIKIDDVTDEMLAELRERYNVRFEGGERDNGLFVAYYKKAADGSDFKFKRQKFWFDLYVWYPYQGNKTIMKVTLGKSTRKTWFQPAHCIEDFDIMEFQGRILRVPKDIDAWLTGWYGPNWQTPDPNWHKSSNFFYEEKTYSLKDYISPVVSKKLF